MTPSAAAEGGAGAGRRALIPAFCNLLGLPYLNSSAHACTLARHKFHANAVLGRAGVRVPQTWQFDLAGWSVDDRPKIGSRVICKPAYESMCIGVDEHSVRVVDESFDLYVAERRSRYGQPVIVQEFVSGAEVGVPIMRSGRASYALPPVEFLHADGRPFATMPRTFKDENIMKDTATAPWRPRDRSIYRAVQTNAVEAFDALEMGGVGRIDLRVDIDGRAWVFDTNESPPPLAGTSFARSMEILGFSVQEMLAMWVGACLNDIGVHQESDQYDSSHIGTSRP